MIGLLLALAACVAGTSPNSTSAEFCQSAASAADEGGSGGEEVTLLCGDASDTPDGYCSPQGVDKVTVSQEQVRAACADCAIGWMCAQQTYEVPECSEDGDGIDTGAADALFVVAKCSRSGAM